MGHGGEINRMWPTGKGNGKSLQYSCLLEACPWQGHVEGSLTKCEDVIRLQGFPLEFLEHPPPKTRFCLLYCVMLSTYSSDINKGLSPHHLFLEKVNLELLDNKSAGHNNSISIQKPLRWLSSLPAGLLQLRMWLFVASRPQDAQEA